MKLLAALVCTIVVADLVFLISGSFLLAAFTGVIGGFSWARSQGR